MYLGTLVALCFAPVLSRAYDVQPFKIDLSSRVPHMKDMIKRTELPESSVLGTAGAGINLSWLKDRQAEWLESFDWKKEEDHLNKFHVVVPSLPGFGFSSPPPAGWSLNTTATLFDTLMHSVLGYKSYMVTGGSWVGYRPF
ncbi:hypothetical protein FRC10_002749 [Ceratobasidium sp. 414]|nr:hypothetical protein FRC10_002749 [Ceratobasidium sp. 414]